MHNSSRLPVASLVLAALAFTACADTPDVTTPDLSARAAIGGRQVGVPAGQTDFIVTFDDTEIDPVGRARALVAQQNGELKHSYQFALKGFAAKMSTAAAAALASTPGIKRVEPDGIAKIVTTVASMSWGQDRIDQRALPLNNTYTYTSTGSGVRVYIIDTGILSGHEQFAGRVLPGFSALGDNVTEDCNGHGTHVAGTVGGSTAGVAPGVSLVPVRVLDCTGSGSWSGVIAGLDWVTQQKLNNKSIPMAANMSLGGGLTSSLNDAVTKAIAAGVVVAVAAGNSSADACQTSPASTPNALTVGASESGDNRAGYSNFGSCLDIFAPGTGITSAWIGATNAYSTISGTSMASPHVAGVAALILSAYPSYSPDQVRSSMLAAATPNIVTNPGSGSPNMLLTNLFTASTAPPPPPPDTTTIVPPPPAPTPVITMTVTKQKSGKWVNASIYWRGATTTNVDIWRGSTLLITTPNDGQQTDSKIGTGTWTYKVCQAGSTTICSLPASVVN